ncbi:PFL_4669 family integrating conjugative element protein [Carnimonas bestiolae]|uniref:PFL_4669 family integrating conjugative element protein n=1 Tax=Carnimonas bestiolae TaxID=3402172 RepID=UPI003EDBD8AA
MAANDQHVGNLRSKIEMTLHTYPAVQMWMGRGVESGKPQVIGLKQFLFMVGRINQVAVRDDPYADHWLLKVEERINTAETLLDNLSQRINSVLEQIPEGLDVSRNVSQQPFVSPVFTGGPLGWKAIMLLMKYDSLVRDVLLAHHIGLVGKRQRNSLIRDQAGHALRSLCNAPDRFPGFSGATRDDFAANNAKARNAVEKHGELPEDILNGSRRSEFAPDIRREASVMTPSKAAGAELEGGDLDLDEEEPASDAEATDAVANNEEDSETKSKD